MLKKLLTIAICLLFLSSIANAAWLGDGSTRRQKITIQGANLDGNLTHFPVYVYIDPAAEGATMTEAANDGTDIRFTESDGTTLLDHELEYWSGGGGGAVTAHFWVSNAGWTINADGSTELYVYYGSGGADGENATGVWDASFMMVQHMDDDPDNQHIDDSTGTHDGTKGAADEPTEIAGLIDRGQNFDGGDWIAEAVAPVTAYPHTISAWVKTSTNGFRMVAGMFDNDTENSWDFLCIDNAESGAAWTRLGAASAYALGGVDIVDGTWHQLVAVFASSISRKIYLDGAFKVENTTNVNPVGNHDSWCMGREHDPSPGRYYVGDADEVRITDDVRTLNEIKFEYHNISEADNELTWSAEEAEDGEENAIFFGINFLARLI